jgi:predicted RND superfamily exporter protein
MLVLSGILFLSGYSILPVNFGEVPLDLSKDATKLRTDAWTYASDNDEIVALSGGQKERTAKYDPIQLVYEGDNVFTRENLLSLKHFEDTLFNRTSYQSELCLLQETKKRTCTKPYSILRFFDGSYAALNSTFYDPNFENIVGVIHTATLNKKSNAILNFHLGKNARISSTEVFSRYTRSLLFTGLPLKGYESRIDRNVDQKKELDRRVVEIFWDTFKEKYEDGVGKMNFYYFTQSLWTAALQHQIIYDMMLAVASLCFIFLFCWFQTGSLWITSWGIFSIFSSFNITNLLYRIVLDYRYFGVFHVMSIFIILGIGSDNVFVFMDMWKQSAGRRYRSLAHRMSDVYRKSAKTMFVTSITTVVAFLSNAPSPLLAISSFGIFSAVLVFVNYLSVILFFPTVVMYHYSSRKGT